MRRPRAVPEARLAVRLKAPFPPVKRLSGDPKTSARPCDVSLSGRRFLQHLESPRPQPGLLCLCHRLSTLGILPREENEICYRCLGTSQSVLGSFVRDPPWTEDPGRHGPRTRNQEPG